MEKEMYADSVAQAQYESVLAPAMDWSKLLQKGDISLSHAWRLGHLLMEQMSAPKVLVVRARGSIASTSHYIYGGDEEYLY